MLPQMRSILRRTLWLLVALLAAGCTNPGLFPNDVRAYSPPKYREQRALMLRPVKVAEGESMKDTWALKFAHEIQRDEYIKDLQIANGDPISVVVSDVYLPHEPDGNDAARDIALLLDIETSGDRKLESYALWYERGVHPGQRLGFTSLLVYSDSAWKSQSQPYFRLRVIDVSKERNQETQSALDGLSHAIGSLATFIPHPAIPGAATAIRTAGLVLSNRANVTILDFTPQFYASTFVSEAKQSDLAIFSRGMWLVVGREPAADETFWNEPLFFHMKTGQILDSKGRARAVPYVRMVVSTFDAVVPSIVLSRSKLLFDLIADKQGASASVVEAISAQIKSAVQTYQAHQSFVNVKSNDAFDRLLKEASSTSITNEDKEFLNVILRRASGRPNESYDQIATWWKETGQKTGHIDSNTGRWTVDSGQKELTK
jgi:hypothetical protein